MIQPTFTSAQSCFFPLFPFSSGPLAFYHLPSHHLPSHKYWSQLYSNVSICLPGDLIFNVRVTIPFGKAVTAGEGNGTPLQCSWLESSRDGGAWWAAIYGVAQSRTRLSDAAAAAAAVTGKRQ